MSDRLLLVHSGGVGDFICAFPALAALRDAWRVEVAGIPERAALAVDAGLATAAHDLERTGFHSVFSTPDDQLRDFARPFRRAMVFMADEDGVIAAGLRAAGMAEVCCAAGVPPAGWKRPAAHWYAEALGVAIDLPFQARFEPSAEAPEVVIHPGSGGRTKNWPAEHFHEVARDLRARGRDVAWILGPAELEAGLKLDGCALPPMELSRLASVLSTSRLYIGNDSGISHLAAAAGCPSLVIFGPTDPDVWAPSGPRARVLRGAPWPSPEAVLEEAISLGA